MGVLFALRQWKRVPKCEATLWYILGRNHLNVNSATSLAIKNQIFDHMWNFTICHARKQKYTDSIFLKIHFANKNLSTSLQNDPIKLGAGQYQCPFCPMIMTQKATMKRHIMTHTGEKPFKCRLCQYASGRKASLLYHIQHIHGVFSNWEKFLFL